MTRIAITSDVHADDYAWAPVDPQTGMNARFVDMLGTAQSVAAQARMREAEVLVMCGDYTESKVPTRTPRAEKIAKAFDAGPDRQLHVQGNHDTAWAGESIVSILGRNPGWDGYTAPGISRVGDVAICAIPYLDRRWARVQPRYRDVTDAVLFAELREEYLTIARGLYAIAAREGARRLVLVGHQQLAGAQMTDSQRAFLGDLDLVVDANALAEIGWDAVVMGHVHRAQTVVEPGVSGFNPVLYVGSQERVDFAEEHETKSYVILDLGVGRKVTIERVEIPARRLVTIDGGELGNHGDIEGAIVRVVNLPAAFEPSHVRQSLIVDDGAFAVSGVTRAVVDRQVNAEAHAIASAKTPDDQLAAALLGDPNAERLLTRGRELMAIDAEAAA